MKKQTEAADPARVADRLRLLCSRREYCRTDVMKKATEALGGDGAEAEKIVSMLVKEKYVDDLRYASAFARDKASISGWGSVKIRYHLSSKGIGRSVIDAALEEIDSGRAEQRLEKLMENKFRSLASDPQCRLKMLRFGLGRGYDYDEVSKITDSLVGKAAEKRLD